MKAKTRAREIEKLIQPWAETGLALEIIDADLAKLFGSVPESPLHEGIWRLYDAYTDAMEALVGPSAQGWMSWFHADNEFGRRGYQARVDSTGPLRRIWTVSQLARLLAELEETPL